MPLLLKPTSDAGRSNLLSTSAKTAQADAKSGFNYLSPGTIKDALSLSDEFTSKLKSEAGSVAGRAKEVREKNEAVVRLEVFIRDQWEVLKRRVFRNNEPAEVLTFYQLPLDGTVPKVINEKEIFTLANKIIEGDAKAIKAGYPAAVCPSVAELSKVRDAAQKEADEVAMADRQYNDAQKALAPIREKANVLIDDIIAELNYTLRKLEPAHQRRIMRSYGITFKYAPGEPVDEATPAAPATQTNS